MVVSYFFFVVANHHVLMNEVEFVVVAAAWNDAVMVAPNLVDLELAKKTL